MSRTNRERWLLLCTGAMGTLTARRILLFEWAPALADALVLALVVGLLYLNARPAEKK